jgi:hypothetical protein
MLSELNLIPKFAPRKSNTQLTNYIRGDYNCYAKCKMI